MPQIANTLVTNSCLGTWCSRKVKGTETDRGISVTGKVASDSAERRSTSTSPETGETWLTIEEEVASRIREAPQKRLTILKTHLKPFGWVRLQCPEAMLWKQSLQLQENIPETRTENAQLQHRDRQPKNNQARKQKADTA